MLGHDQVSGQVQYLKLATYEQREILALEKRGAKARAEGLTDEHRGERDWAALRAGQSGC